MSATVTETDAPVRIGNEVANSDLQIVHILTRVLAGQCDGARTPDGKGFNKFHAHFGQVIAETPFESLSDRQLWAARKTLETYRNTQLKDFWHLVPEIPEPPKPDEEVKADSDYARWKRERNPHWRPTPKTKELQLSMVGGREHFAFYTSYDKRTKDAIKAMPGARWVWDDKQAEQGHWTVPVTHDTLEIVTEFAVGNAFDVPSTVVERIDGIMQEYDGRRELSYLAEKDGIELSLPDGLQLYPFQRVGVEYIRKTPNVLVADQMGLGKTVQALIGVNETHSYPCVVVCPASLKANWKNEIEKWLPGKRVVILTGKLVARLRWSEDNEPAFDVVIINYDILEKWLPNLIDFLGGEVVMSEDGRRQLPYDNRRDGKPFYGSVILDECHAVKNNKAQRTKNVKQLLRACNYSRRIFLSGTPVVNRPMEFWSLIQLLGYESAMGGYSQYRARYDTSYRPNLEELNTRARSMFMVRRAKKDVLTELPDKQHTIIPLEIDNRKEYEKAEADIAHFFATKKAEKADYETAEMQILMQAVKRGLSGDEATAFVTERMLIEKGMVYAGAYSMAERNENLLRWEALKQLAVKGKMRAVYEWLDEFLDTGEKIVVFATHTNVIEELARRYRAPYIHGSVAPDRRQPLVDRFQTDPNTRMIIGNIKAMGEGLTLTAASDVAFVEFGWNPKDHDQAEDRCHRIGQKAAVQVWNLAADYTIDFEIAQLIENKRAITEAITDGGDRDMQAQMMQELQDRLYARLNKKR